MTRTVKCQKSGKESLGLEKPPFPGQAGQRIYENISAESWQEWLKLQTMLINEHRLTPFEPEAKKFLAAEREKFLFGGANTMPEGYRPPAD